MEEPNGDGSEELEIRWGEKMADILTEGGCSPSAEHQEHLGFPPTTAAALQNQNMVLLPVDRRRTPSPPPPVLLSVNFLLFSDWLESSGGKEGIDLSVVLGDQLIPIVCASTDSWMCLIRYGLFLLGRDKSPPITAPSATNQRKGGDGMQRGPPQADWWITTSKRH